MAYNERLRILENKDLFQRRNQDWGFILLGTKFQYNSLRNMWTTGYQEHYISFESMFDNIMSDSKMPNEVKENIIFNLVDLKSLNTKDYK